jgi:ATP-dependent helicase/nuclease subunit A
VDQERLIRYPSLASTLVRQNLLRQTMAEELRLLYVAMTRAKEHLILVATCGVEDRQRWQSQWSGHDGPLPPDAVQGAKRVIDWLGPVAAITAGASHPIFELHEYDAADVRTWKNPRHQRPEFSARQKGMVRLEPLPGDPPMNDAARQLIQRFQTVYPFDAYTRVPATASVTSLAKGIAAQARESLPLGRKLDLPRFFQKEATPRATDIGNATHALLQYFDFSGAATLPRIERQIAELVDRKLLSAQDAGLVDRAAVLWLLESEVGKLIRAGHARLMREVPFALMRPAQDSPPSEDASDQIMIRGRIDLLVPTESGLAIVDYKTDRVSEPELEQRAQAYGRQMQLYAEAIRKVAGGKIAAVYLVFLTPRRIVSIGDKRPG